MSLQIDRSLNSFPAEQIASPSEILSAPSSEDKLFEIVRRCMPIKALFNPSLNIDFALFMKNQRLMADIAKFIQPLQERKKEVDFEDVRALFSSSEILREIQDIFNVKEEKFLACLYSICSEALNQAEYFPAALESVIGGRIFSLKNALYAIIKPEAILQSQRKNRLSPQLESEIRQEGTTFIRTCLQMYLSIETLEEMPFLEELQATAEKLVPFTALVTQSYLRENGVACSSDMLKFRNPTGYNRHGLTAAMVMDVCLTACGYNTRLVNRCDLEPRVTLATSHALVEVCETNGRKYLVDASYLQFYKDVYFEQELPDQLSSVLVLEAESIEGHIETAIMPLWKRRARQLHPYISELQNSDRLMPFIAEGFGIGKGDAAREDWVRQAFKRVWNLKEYLPVPSDQGFQEVFFGTGRRHQTHDLIRAMNLASCSKRLSVNEIKQELNQMTRGGKRIDAVRAMNLISQIYLRAEREPYCRLLECDPRLLGRKGLETNLNAYLFAMRKIVNPESQDLKVLYGCSGADCLSILLATDASDMTFVDLTAVSISQFRDALEMLQSGNPLAALSVEAELSKNHYLFFRSIYGGGISRLTDGTHTMDNVPLKILYDLQLMGVDLNSISLRDLGQEKVQLEFDWRYYNAASDRRRSITLIRADITDPQNYPRLLKEKVKKGFDIFYMKAAFTAPESYGNFLPYLAAFIRTDGWLMTSDKTNLMELHDPEPILANSGQTFIRRAEQELTAYQALIKPPFSPLVDVPMLARERIMRTPGTDATYWTVQNLRQKS